MIELAIVTICAKYIFGVDSFINLLSKLKERNNELTQEKENKNKNIWYGLKTYNKEELIKHAFQLYSKEKGKDQNKDNNLKEFLEMMKNENIKQDVIKNAKEHLE